MNLYITRSIGQRIVNTQFYINTLVDGISKFTSIVFIAELVYI